LQEPIFAKNSPKRSQNMISYQLSWPASRR
jgi:hypothetical protein